MNYEELVRTMLIDATDKDIDEAAEKMGEVVRACGIGIALVAIGLPKELIEQYMTEVNRAIYAQIRLFDEIKVNNINSEAFLLEHFNPGVFHG